MARTVVDRELGYRLQRKLATAVACLRLLLKYPPQLASSLRAQPAGTFAAAEIVDADGTAMWEWRQEPG